jgi:hypothetical protein
VRVALIEGKVVPLSDAVAVVPDSVQFAYAPVPPDAPLVAMVAHVRAVASPTIDVTTPATRIGSA